MKKQETADARATLTPAAGTGGALIRRLYRHISDATRRVDDGSAKSKSVSDLFEPSLQIQRQKLKDNCEKLIFEEPLLYGKKAQELLWRKCFYEVISAMKKLRQNSKEGDELVLMLIESGVGYYHNLIAKVQTETEIEFSGLVDYPQLETEYGGSTVDENLKSWAKSCIQSCLIYLGDLCRYKLELEGGWEPSISARYYLQAFSVDTAMGMPYNQLGNLYAGKNYQLDSVRFYLTSLACDNPFESSDANLVKIFEKNAKYLDSKEAKHPDIIDQQESVKSLLCKFLSLIEYWYFEKDVQNFNDLCAAVLYDFKECLPYRCLNFDFSMTNEEYLKYLQQNESSPDFLSPKLLYNIIMILFLCLEKLKRENSNHLFSLKAFTLALFAQFLQKMVIEFTDMGFEVQNPIKVLVDYKETKAGKYSAKKIIKPKQEEIEPKAEDETVEKSNEETNTNGSNNRPPKSVKTKAQKVRRRRKKSGSDSDDSESSSMSSSEEETEDSSESSEEYDEEDEYSTCSNSEDDDNDDEDAEDDENPPEDNIEDAKKTKKGSEVLNMQLFKHFFEHDNTLMSVSLLMDWLCHEVDLLISCGSSGKTMTESIVDILNIMLRQIYPKIVKNVYSESHQEHPSLKKFHEVLVNMRYVHRNVPLPEDFDLRSVGVFKEQLRNLDWDYHKFQCLSQHEINAVRLMRFIDFGMLLAKQKIAIIYNKRLKLYMVKSPVYNKKVIPKKFKKTGIKHKLQKLKMNGHSKHVLSSEKPDKDESLMKNMGRLYLSEQVRELESAVHKNSRHPNLPALVVVDADSLCHHLHIIKRLVTTKKVIVLIPTIVLQSIDQIKKESSGARNATRWLEFQLRSGSRFLRTQRPIEMAPVPHLKFPKKMPKEVHHFIQIIEFCHYFLVKDEETKTSDIDAPEKNKNVIVLLTGGNLTTENKEVSLTGLAESAGVSVENIQEFFGKRQNSFGKGDKKR